MTWRAIQTKPAAEKRVEAGLKDEGLTAYLPLERVWRYRQGRKTQHARPLIRGYVFANLTDDELHLIHSIDGATRYVGVQGAAACIPDAFVEGLKGAQAQGMFDQTLSQTKRFTQGQHVRITTGEFAGRVGAIARLNSTRRVKILLDVATGSWPVTADVGQLEAA